MSGPIINLEKWFASPAGQHLRAWTLARSDQSVSRCFGYHALQIGAPYLPLLRNCRIQHQWVAATLPIHRGHSLDTPLHAHTTLCLNATALPFAESSIDLIVLPYILERALNPHATLREAARVLVPEGHLLVLGINPTSLWGLQHRCRILARRLGSQAAPVIPEINQPIAIGQLRDWLSLLGFEVKEGCFGSYRPILNHAAWFQRLRWLDAAGDRWWPFLGGAYFLLATKRVRGVRLVQPAWQLGQQAGGATAAIQNQALTKNSAPSQSTTLD